VAKGGDWTPAEEMARSDLKDGRAGCRTPFQILADYYQTGDTRDRDLWSEYRIATRGLAATRSSRGLRALMLGPHAESELTDEALAAIQTDSDLFVVIPLACWQSVRYAGIDHRLLVAAECGGLPAVSALLRLNRSNGPPQESTLR
jgi:hypothetical protein